MSRRTLKRLALGYVVKTLILGIAWLAIPDLPQRAMRAAQQAWSHISGGSADPD